eukprot:3550550-Pyramimonas_sp.AAC.2
MHGGHVGHDVGLVTLVSRAGGAQGKASYVWHRARAGAGVTLVSHLCVVTCYTCVTRRWGPRRGRRMASSTCRSWCHTCVTLVCRDVLHLCHAQVGPQEGKTYGIEHAPEELVSHLLCHTCVS